MITASYINFISENFITTVSHRDQVTNVYENPGSSDYTKIRKELKKSDNNTIKFIADNNKKKVYVFDAWTAEHTTVLRKLGYVGFFERNNNPQIIEGTGIVQPTGKPVVNWKPLGIEKEDWQWLTLYFSLR